MEINSVLSTGIEGVKSGIQTAQDAAQTIATIGNSDASTSPSAESGSPDRVSLETTPNGLNTLTEAIVDLKVGEQQVKASAAVIRTADEVLGTLVDIKA